MVSKAPIASMEAQPSTEEQPPIEGSVELLGVSSYRLGSVENGGFNLAPIISAPAQNWLTEVETLLPCIDELLKSKDKAVSAQKEPRAGSVEIGGVSTHRLGCVDTVNIAPITSVPAQHGLTEAEILSPRIGKPLESNGKVVSAQKEPISIVEASGGLEIVHYVQDREAGEIIEVVEGHNEARNSVDVHTRMMEEGNSLLKHFLNLEGSRQTFELPKMEEQDRLVSDEEEMGSSSPLQMIPLQMVTKETLDWVFKKVKEIQSCVGLFYDGYEEQLMALLVAIEAGRSTAEKSTVRRERELRRLHCSINYDNKEGTSGRDRVKGREAIPIYEA